MICKHCGKQLPKGAGVCIYCGNETEEFNNFNVSNSAMDAGFVQCPHCGHIGKPKLEKILRKKDILLFLLGSFIGVGFIYLIITALLRSNPNKRKLICESCKKDLMLSSSNSNQTNVNTELKNGMNVVKNVIKDKDFQQSVKKANRAFKDFRNSL